jgi:spore maturation protein SpmA/spore maturation protein SpmB
MTLNYIWVGFFVVGFFVALFRTIYGYFGGGAEADQMIFEAVAKGTLDYAKIAFVNVALPLCGILTLWMGFMRLAEKIGAIALLGKVIGPFFRHLFPEIPEGHHAHGQIMFNFSANMLGLSNAATPAGLKAMESLQSLNADKERASNSMIMFLAINTAGFTLIPVTILGLRAAANSQGPADVFIPILLTSFFTMLFAMTYVSFRQRIFSRALGTWLLSAASLMFLVYWIFRIMSPDLRTTVSIVGGNAVLLGIMALFVGVALFKKINVYSEFIEGAKEGFATMVRIVPYLVGMIVAIGVFRTCGALTYITDGLTTFFTWLGTDTGFIPAIPVALMKPLSGGGTEGLVNEILLNKELYGPDSFAGRLASVMYASADTTFYIVALYFGSVGVKNTRYAVGTGLLVDFIGITTAIFISYLFFG